MQAAGAQREAGRSMGSTCLRCSSQLCIDHIVRCKVLEHLPSDAGDGCMGGGEVVDDIEQAEAFAQAAAGCRWVGRQENEETGR